MKKNLMDKIIFFILSFVIIIQSCSQQQIIPNTIQNEDTEKIVDKEKMSFSVKHNDNDIPCLPSNLSNYDKPFTTSSFKIQNTEEEPPLTIEQFNKLNTAIESIKLLSLIDLNTLKKYSDNIVKINERIKLATNIEVINKLKEYKEKEESKKKNLFKQIDDFEDSIISKGLEIRTEAQVLMGHLYPRVHVFNESNPNKRIEMFELFFNSSEYDFNVFISSDNTYELAKAGAVIGRELYVFDDLVYMYIRGQLSKVDSSKYNVLNLLSKYITQINKHKKNYFITHSSIESLIKSIDKQIKQDSQEVILNQQELIDYLNNLETRYTQVDKEIKQSESVLNNIENDLIRISNTLNIDNSLNNLSSFNIKSNNLNFSIKNSSNCRYSGFDGAEYICSQEPIITQKDSGLDSASAGFEAANSNLLDKVSGSMSQGHKIVNQVTPKINKLTEEIKELENTIKTASKSEKPKIEAKINNSKIEKTELETLKQQAERAIKEAKKVGEKATNSLNDIKKLKEAKNTKINKVNKAKDKLDGNIQNKNTVCTNDRCIVFKNYKGPYKGSINLLDEGLQHIISERTGKTKRPSHAPDFGVPPKDNKVNRESLRKVINDLLNRSDITVIEHGLYRGDPATIIVTPEKLGVILNSEGTLLSGWKFSSEQYNRVLKSGVVK